MKKHKHLLASRASLAVVSSFLTLSCAFGVNYTWDPATGDFMDGLNWSGDVVPGAADRGIISNSGTATMSSGSASMIEIWVGQNGSGTQTGTLEQTGGSFTLSDGLAVGRQNGAVGTYTMTGGTLSLVALRVGSGPAGNAGTGTMTVSGAGTTITSTGAGVTGVGVAGTGTLTLANSAVFTHNSTTAFLVGSDNATAGANGGTGTVNVNSGAELNIATGNLAIGRNNLGNGTVNVSGGSITLSGGSAQINLGVFNGVSSAGTGTLTINSGSVTGSIVRIMEGTGTVNLNGGILTTGSMLKSGTNVSAAVNFNGGTLRASAASSDFFSGFSTAHLEIQAGGLIFDTNTHAVTVTQGLDGVGGLTKQGAGTLTLTGVGAYEGDTVIEGGTLSINTIFLVDDSNVSIGGSGVFDLDFAGTDTINMLIFNGVAQGSGTWGSLTSAADHKSAFFTGDGMLFVAVPEPAEVSILIAGALGLLAVARRHPIARK